MSDASATPAATAAAQSSPTGAPAPAPDLTSASGDLPISPSATHQKKSTAGSLADHMKGVFASLDPVAKTVGKGEDFSSP